MTPQHLAIAMEYAPGGDLSEYVDACKRAGVRRGVNHSSVRPPTPMHACSTYQCRTDVAVLRLLLCICWLAQIRRLQQRHAQMLGLWSFVS